MIPENNLFASQSSAFFAAISSLAMAADAAMRGQIQSEQHDRNERRGQNHQY